MQEVFRPSGRTQLCHRDLWADNVRLAGKGGLCVIDWDNCGPAEPAQELAMPLVEFCYDDGDRAARLYRAYRRAGGPGQLADPSDFTMVLAQFGHFAITAGRQWVQATDKTSKRRAEAWFREGWELPLGLPEIERLLHAVRGI
jgi:aminoglycoside phosphotransferase (APT) family kinase protein